MKYRTLLFLAAFFLFAPAAVFAQCTIEGNDYNEGEIVEMCKVCDSSQNATDWSPVICSPLQGIDLACQTGGCIKNVGCVSKQLPEHTRCVDPVCANGSITQRECSTSGTCDDERVKSCQGFACLDAVSCTSECTTNDECEGPATCVRKTCQLPPIGEDMGSDSGSSDMGGDMKTRVDLPTFDMAVSDVKTETDVNGSDPVASGGSCATSNGSSSLGLLLFGCFAFVRRRR